MRRVGLAQINTIVGDLPGNRRHLLESYRSLVGLGAELVVFPELALTGYPPRDLLFKSRFVPDNLEALHALAAEIGPVPALVGFVDHNPSPRGRRFFNAAAWCADGAVQQVFHKCLLPTYDVFDEDRYFEAGTASQIVEWSGLRLAITICEDIWTGPLVETARRYHRDPLSALADAKPDLVLNLSASPWHHGKDSTRLAIVGDAARRVGAKLVYVNAVGGNDELIFDGHSLVMAPDGTLIAGLAGFDEELRVVELDASSQLHPRFHQDEDAEIFSALTLGTRDYAVKSGFRTALIGLSGGIDSAVTAAIAAAALGPANVLGVSLPSRISSQHSRDAAAALARNLGIRYETVPIASVVSAAEAALAPLFAGRAPDATEENIQARARGLLLMAISNKFGSLLLTTGNKSEVSVGYCTLYGDMAGGLAVISDVLKTRVYRLAHWLNRERETIPRSTIDKPPSAELRPDQKDEDSLPPYPVLDEILRLYVEEGASSSHIISAGFPSDIVRDVVRRVDLNEYKRKQAAPGLRITSLAFGVGRRIPLVQRYVG